MAEDNKAAPFLTERLKVEKDESIQRDIIYVLRCMAVNGYLKGQHHIAEVVNKVAAEIENGDESDERVVKDSQTWAKEIEGNTR